MTAPYEAAQPTRASIDELTGSTVLEFGTNWCGYCLGAQPLISAALASHQDIRHLKVEDGSGRPLGRSFGVTLWPTLIFLKDGKEIARVVRPATIEQISAAIVRIA